MVVSVLMMHEFHSAVNRKPVRMDIEKTHEYAYHKTLFMEILVFVNFLYDHDTAVGRCHNDVLCVFLRKISDRAAEKVDHYSI